MSQSKIQTRGQKRINFTNVPTSTSSSPTTTTSTASTSPNKIESHVWFYVNSPPSSTKQRTTSVSTTESSPNKLINNEYEDDSSIFTNDQIIFIKNLIENQEKKFTSRLEAENASLRADIKKLQEELKSKDKLIFEIEKDVIDLQQYIRRNNIEICGIPNNVEDKNLEKKVLEVCDSLGVDVKEEDIEACHRLKDRNLNGPKRTIVRFVNRKICSKLHSKKKVLYDKHNYSIKGKLKDIGLTHGKIFINNNLCPYNKFLWGKCKHLHTEKIIDRFWVFNGHIYVADNENDKGTKIDHFKTLQQIYPGFDFNVK